MRLVVDANIAFSLLKRDSFTRRLSKKHALQLFSHPFVLEELGKYSDILCAKLRVSEDRFERIKELLPKLVCLGKVSPQQLNRARRLLSDPKDAPYLALAIKLGINIWSNDPHMKQQSIVPVVNTEELSNELEPGNVFA